MIALDVLGRELRDRRKRLRIRSTELAQRINVSPTYVWLIEGAKPRPTTGEPSRPSEDVLRRWLTALGVDEVESRRFLELAGYVDLDLAMPVPQILNSPAPGPDSRSPYRHAPMMSEEAAMGRFFAEPASALRRWSRDDRESDPDPEQALSERARELLQRAETHGRGDEAASLLESFLQWLEFHLDVRRRS